LKQAGEVVVRGGFEQDARAAIIRCRDPGKRMRGSGEKVDAAVAVIRGRDPGERVIRGLGKDTGVVIRGGDPDQRVMEEVAPVWTP